MRKIVRGGVVAAVAAGVLAVPSSASAATLDQVFCEAAGPAGLGGIWSAGTCTVNLTNLTNQTVTVPSGITLTNSGGAGAFDLDLTIEAGGTVEITGGASDFTTSSVDNSGTFDVQSSLFTLTDSTFVNRGTLSAPTLWVLGASSVDNFDAATVGTMLLESAATWINHCRSTFPTPDFDVDSTGTVTDLTCSIVVTITPAPASGGSPLPVAWTITLTNDGDEPLTAPQVALSTDGGATAFATLTAPPTSGDAGTTGVLDVDETWAWTVDTTETANVTVTATGAGTLEGDVITFPDDADARAAASVTVTTTSTSTTTTTTTTAPTSTAAPTTAAPTTVAPTTAAPTTSNTINVGATLPSTGPSGPSSFGLTVLAGLMVLVGGSMLALRRRA